MKFATKTEALALLAQAPIGISEVRSMAALNVLAGLAKSGLASFAGGYYSRNWTVAK